MSSDFIRIAIDSTGLPEEMSTVMVNAIKSFGIFSLNVLAKIKASVVEKIADKLATAAEFKDIEKDILFAMVEAGVAAASSQLDLVMYLGKERSSEELQSAQSKKAFEDDLAKYIEKNGELHADLIPTKTFYDSIKKDPLKYHDLTKSVSTSDSSALSKLASALAEKTEEESLLDVKNSKILLAGQWLKAINKLLVCISLVTDLKPLNISYYIYRIGEIASRHGWHVAMLCDIEIRRRIEKIYSSGKVSVNEVFVNDTMTEACIAKILSSNSADKLNMKAAAVVKSPGFRGIKQASLPKPQMQGPTHGTGDGSQLKRSVNCFEWNDHGKCQQEANCPFSLGHTAEKAGCWAGQTVKKSRPSLNG
jgi:hypothetical protein